MSQEHSLQFRHRPPPRCYTRPVSLVATPSPTDPADAAPLILGLLVGAAFFAAGYGAWFY
jgi:hypothetical protein